MRYKGFLTTGEIARLCRVNVTTVGRWLKRGVLKGYQLGFGHHRRVRVEDFIAFCKDSNLPVPLELSAGVKRVLIVTGENGKTVAGALRKAGFDVQVAGNSFEAGTKWIAWVPEILVLDLDTPGLDGEQVIRFCREGCPECGEERKQLNILALSASRTVSEESLATLGVDAFLPKPVQAKAIQQAVMDLTSAH